MALYYAIPHRFRWLILLAASYYFYAAWNAEYLLLIIFSTLIDYFCGLRMGNLPDQARRKPYLIISLATNLGLLFFFKYADFLSDSVEATLNAFNIFASMPGFDLLLPVGISFYTFQTLSYSIDVYRGKTEPERHLGRFALFVSFFPQLVAGPIERSSRLLPQFQIDHQFGHRFKYGNLTAGLKWMLWGFFLKLVIADRLAIYVNEVYNNPGIYEGLPVVLATYFFAFQIYCDFAGYSLIAIGAAKVMGYDLSENFRQPYFSRSIAEFWRRWHISLSGWFRDYVYIPLGGNRVVKWRWYYNLFIVFAVSGLWHGANWTFVVWGSLHGAYLIGSLVSRRFRDGLWARLKNGLKYLTAWIDANRIVIHDHKISGLLSVRSVLAVLENNIGRLRNGLAMIVTFHLAIIAWVFFRANTLSDGQILLASIVPQAYAAGISWSTDYTLNGLIGQVDLMLITLSLGFLIIFDAFERKKSVHLSLMQWPTWLRWAFYQAIFLWILFFGTFGKAQFLYFQF